MCAPKPPYSSRGLWSTRRPKASHRLNRGAEMSTHDRRLRFEELADVEPLWPVIGRFLRLGRNATLAAAHRGDIPTLRFGRRLMVSRLALRRVLDEGRLPSVPQTAGGDAPQPLRRRAAR